MATMASDAAQDLARRRESLQRQTARVDEAIALWRRWEANQTLPPGEPQPITPRELSRVDCLTLHRMLAAALDYLG